MSKKLPTLYDFYSIATHFYQIMKIGKKFAIYEEDFFYKVRMIAEEFLDFDLDIDEDPSKTDINANLKNIKIHGMKREKNILND